MTGISDLPYPVKWLIVGAMIGAVAGASALIFYLMLKLTTYLFMDLIVGYKQPEPPGLGGSTTYIIHVGKPWLIPVSTVLGAVIVGYLAARFREARAGLDNIIEAYHHRRKPFSNALVGGLMTAILSAITIGSGGSAGPEAPTGNLGASLSYLIAEKLGLTDDDRAIAMVSGMGAALGAIFKAPIGGALLASEILYRRDFEPVVLYPALISSIMAYLIFCIVTGFKPYLGTINAATPPQTLPIYVLLGIIDGAMAIVYIEALDHVGKAFGKLRVNYVVKAVIGGLIVGIIGILAPQILGGGDGWIGVSARAYLMNFTSAVLPVLILIIALPALKAIATATTLGSGGVGGVFAPGLTVGAFTGLAFWLLIHTITPSLAPSPAPFIIVSTAATFSAASNAPIAIMAMVLEMVNDYQVIPSMAIATATAYLITTWRYTVFKAQRINRRDI